LVYLKLGFELLPRGFDIENYSELLAISQEFPNKQLLSLPNLEVVSASVSLLPVVTYCVVYAPQLNITPAIYHYFPIAT